MPVSRTYRLQPGLFKTEDSPVLVIPFSIFRPDFAILQAFVSVAHRDVAVGLAATYTRKGYLKTLAVASRGQVLYVPMDLNVKKGTKANGRKLRQILQDKIPHR